MPSRLNHWRHTYTSWERTCQIMHHRVIYLTSNMYNDKQRFCFSYAKLAMLSWLEGLLNSFSCQLDKNLLNTEDFLNFPSDLKEDFPMIFLFTTKMLSWVHWILTRSFFYCQFWPNTINISCIDTCMILGEPLTSFHFPCGRGKQ